MSTQSADAIELLLSAFVVVDPSRLKSDREAAGAGGVSIEAWGRCCVMSFSRPVRKLLQLRSRPLTSNLIDGVSVSL